MQGTRSSWENAFGNLFPVPFLDCIKMCLPQPAIIDYSVANLTWMYSRELLHKAT